MLKIYKLALDATTESVNLARIEGLLRELKISLQPRPDEMAWEGEGTADVMTMAESPEARRRSLDWRKVSRFLRGAGLFKSNLSSVLSMQTADATAFGAHDGDGDGEESAEEEGEGEEEAAGGSSSEAIMSAVRLPAFPENTQTSSPLPARMESSEDLSVRAVPEPSAGGK